MVGDHEITAKCPLHSSYRDAFSQPLFYLSASTLKFIQFPPSLLPSNMVIILRRDQMRKQDSNSAGHRSHCGVAERQTQTDLLSADCGLM